MTKGSRKLTTIIFLITIFAIGLITMYNCRGTIKDVIKTGNYLHCKSEVEESLTDDFGAKYQWVNVNGLFQRALGVTIVRGGNGDVYKLSNGQIMYDLGERDMTWYADEVKKLDDTLDEKGIRFMYVQYPFKIKDSSYMPPGTKVYGNSNAAQLVELLRERGVDTLSLPEEIEKQGLDWTSLFFNTDHHWRPQTGLWASGLIMNRIEDEYGFDIDESCYDSDNYDVKTYKNYILGSIGRRTGIPYAGLDDLDLLNPKFETDFHFYFKDKNGDEEIRDGNFWDTMYLWSNMEKRADFESNTYAVYTGRNVSINKVRNNKCKNGLKILMIRDSFSCVVLPFVSMNAEQVTAIDLRRYHKKSVVKLCEELKPDVVLLAYNPSAFSKKQFRFFKRK